MFPKTRDVSPRRVVLPVPPPTVNDRIFNKHQHNSTSSSISVKGRSIGGGNDNNTGGGGHRLSALVDFHRIDEVLEGAGGAPSHQTYPTPSSAKNNTNTTTSLRHMPRPPQPNSAVVVGTSGVESNIQPPPRRAIPHCALPTVGSMARSKQFQQPDTRSQEADALLFNKYNTSSTYIKGRGGAAASSPSSSPISRSSEHPEADIHVTEGLSGVSKDTSVVSLADIEAAHMRELLVWFSRRQVELGLQLRRAAAKENRINTGGSRDSDDDDSDSDNNNAPPNLEAVFDAVGAKGIEGGGKLLNKEQIQRQFEHYAPNEDMEQAIGLPSRQYSVNYFLPAQKAVFMRWVEFLTYELRGHNAGTFGASAPTIPGSQRRPPPSITPLLTLFLTRVQRMTAPRISPLGDVGGGNSSRRGSMVVGGDAGGGGGPLAGGRRRSSVIHGITPVAGALTQPRQFNARRGSSVAYQAIAGHIRRSPAPLSIASAVYVFVEHLLPLLVDHQSLAADAFKELLYYVYVSTPPEISIGEANLRQQLLLQNVKPKVVNSRPAPPQGATQVPRSLRATINHTKTRSSASASKKAEQHQQSPTAPSHVIDLFELEDDDDLNGEARLGEYLVPTNSSMFEYVARFYIVSREVSHRKNVFWQKKSALLTQAVMRIANQTVARMFFGWNTYVKSVRRVKERYRTLFLGFSTTAFKKSLLVSWRDHARRLHRRREEARAKQVQATITNNSIMMASRLGGGGASMGASAKATDAKKKLLHQRTVLNAMRDIRSNKQSIVDDLRNNIELMKHRGRVLDDMSKRLQQANKAVGAAFVNITDKVLPRPEDVPAFLDVLSQRRVRGKPDESLGASDVWSSFSIRQDSISHVGGLNGSAGSNSNLKVLPSRRRQKIQSPGMSGEFSSMSTPTSLQPTHNPLNMSLGFELDITAPKLEEERSQEMLLWMIRVAEQDPPTAGQNLESILLNLAADTSSPLSFGLVMNMQHLFPLLRLLLSAHVPPATFVPPNTIPFQPASTHNNNNNNNKLSSQQQNNNNTNSRGNYNSRGSMVVGGGESFGSFHIELPEAPGDDDSGCDLAEAPSLGSLTNFSQGPTIALPDLTVNNANDGNAAPGIYISQDSEKAHRSAAVVAASNMLGIQVTTQVSNGSSFLSATASNAHTRTPSPSPFATRSNRKQLSFRMDEIAARVMQPSSPSPYAAKSPRGGDAGDGGGARLKRKAGSMKNLQAVENAAKEVTNSDTFKSTRRRQSAKWGGNDPESLDQQMSAAAFEGSLALASSFAVPSPTTGTIRDADSIDFTDLRMRSIRYLLRPFLEAGDKTDFTLLIISLINRLVSTHEFNIVSGKPKKRPTIRTDLDRSLMASSFSASISANKASTRFQASLRGASVRKTTIAASRTTIPVGEPIFTAVSSSEPPSYFFFDVSKTDYTPFVESTSADFEIIPQSICRHLLRKSMEWRKLLLTTLYFSQVGDTCGAFRTMTTLFSGPRASFSHFTNYSVKSSLSRVYPTGGGGDGDASSGTPGASRSGSFAVDASSSSQEPRNRRKQQLREQHQIHAQQVMGKEKEEQPSSKTEESPAEDSSTSLASSTSKTNTAPEDSEDRSGSTVSLQVPTTSVTHSNLVPTPVSGDLEVNSDSEVGFTPPAPLDVGLLARQATISPINAAYPVSSTTDNNTSSSAASREQRKPSKESSSKPRRTRLSQQLSQGVRAAGLETGRDIKAFFDERKAVRDDTGIAELAQTAAKTYMESVRELVTLSYSSSALSDECGKVFESYCLASPDIVDAIFVTAHFISQKLRILFGRDSTFWKKVVSTRPIIKSAKEMEELVVTLAPGAGMSPMTLCHQFMAVLDDLDLFYLASGSQEVQDAFAEHLTDLSVIFSLYAKGEPPHFYVDLKGWMTLSVPFFDATYTSDVAEDVYNSTMKRFHNGALYGADGIALDNQQFLAVSGSQRRGSKSPSATPMDNSQLNSTRRSGGGGGSINHTGNYKSPSTQPLSPFPATPLDRQRVAYDLRNEMAGPEDQIQFEEGGGPTRMQSLAPAHIMKPSAIALVNREEDESGSDFNSPVVSAYGSPARSHISRSGGGNHHGSPARYMTPIPILGNIELDTVTSRVVPSATGEDGIPEGMDLDALCGALCVLVSIKVPNPLLPLEHRVGEFIRDLLVPIVGTKAKANSGNQRRQFEKSLNY